MPAGGRTRNRARGRGEGSDATLKRPAAGRRNWAKATHAGSPETKGLALHAETAAPVRQWYCPAGCSAGADMLVAGVERTSDPPRPWFAPPRAARFLGACRHPPEHELLGLLADPDSDAGRALNSLGVTADRARERVLEIVPRGDRLTGQVPFTMRAKKVSGWAQTRPRSAQRSCRCCQLRRRRVRRYLGRFGLRLTCPRRLIRGRALTFASGVALGERRSESVSGSSCRDGRR